MADINQYKCYIKQIFAHDFGRVNLPQTFCEWIFFVPVADFSSVVVVVLLVVVVVAVLVVVVTVQLVVAS